MGGSVTLLIMEHIKMNNLHKKADIWVDSFMGSNLTLSET